MNEDRIKRWNSDSKLFNPWLFNIYSRFHSKHGKDDSKWFACLMDGKHQSSFHFQLGRVDWVQNERRIGALFLTDLLLCLEKVHQKHYRDLNPKKIRGPCPWCQTLIYINLLYIIWVCECHTSFHIESPSKQWLNPGTKAMNCRSMNPVWRRWWRLLWRMENRKQHIGPWGRVIGHDFPRCFFGMNICNNNYFDVNYRVPGLWPIAIWSYIGLYYIYTHTIYWYTIWLCMHIVEHLFLKEVAHLRSAHSSVSVPQSPKFDGLQEHLTLPSSSPSFEYHGILSIFCPVSRHAVARICSSRPMWRKESRRRTSSSLLWTLPPRHKVQRVPMVPMVPSGAVPQDLKLWNRVYRHY